MRSSATASAVLWQHWLHSTCLKSSIKSNSMCSRMDHLALAINSLLKCMEYAWLQLGDLFTQQTLFLICQELTLVSAHESLVVESILTVWWTRFLARVHRDVDSKRHLHWTVRKCRRGSELCWQLVYLGLWLRLVRSQALLGRVHEGCVLVLILSTNCKYFAQIVYKLDSFNFSLFLVRTSWFYVNKRTVESDPELKIQGWVGWNIMFKTPKSSTIWWPFKIFKGTIIGFCNKSL